MGSARLNILFLLLEKVVSVALVFVCEGIVARNLSSTDYGRWLYGINFVIMFSAFSVIAGAEVIVPLLVRYKRARWLIMINAFYLRLISGILAYFFLWFYVEIFIEDELIASILKTAGLILIFNESFAVTVAYYQSVVQIRKVSVVRFLGLCVRLVVVYIWVKLNWSAYYISYSRIAESIFLAIFLGVLWYSAAQGRFSFRFRVNIATKLLGYGLKVYPAIVLMYLFQKLDRVFVERYFSLDYVAQYGVAMQLIEQINVVIMLIMQSLAPKYLYATKSRDARLIGGRLFYGLIGLSVSIVFVGFFAGPILVRVIYGAPYAGSGYLFKSMLFVPIFYAFDLLITNFLISRNLYWSISIKWLISFFAYVVCSYIYFENYANYGAGWLVSLNYFILAGISLLVYKYHEKKSDI